MSASVIAVAALKGGVGRTTVAMTLAASLVRRSLKVIVLDAHTQRSASTWADGDLLQLKVVAVDEVGDDRTPNLHIVKDLVEACDVLVVDCPPGEQDLANWWAVQRADLVLTPIVLTALDVVRVTQLLKIVRSTKMASTADPMLAGVINKAKPTVLSRAHLELLQTWEEPPLLKARLSDRVAYQEAAALGSSVFHRDDPVAMQEAEALTTEVLALLVKRTGRRPAVAVQLANTTMQAIIVKEPTS